MLKKALVSKIAISCVALIGLAQATTITITPATTTYTKGNTQWQDIKSVSYSWADADNDGLIAVGNKVSFTVDMHKTDWGMHDYDALKFWIDKEVSPSGTTNLLTSTGIWDFDPTNKNMTSDAYTSKKWKGGDKLFTFDYTFTTAGTYDITQSVMCSADLSKLAAPTSGAPNASDWNAWTEDIHKTTKGYIQGETEKYKLTVVTKKIPEPGSMSMILIGLVSLAG